VALSDVSLLLASPYGEVRRSKLAGNAARILAIARREGPAVWWSACPVDGRQAPARRPGRAATGRTR